jgi:glycosyltransferase involved in cell wall biosynthesis
VKTVRLMFFISSYNIGGFETRLRRLVRTLDAKRFRPYVFVLRPDFRVKGAGVERIEDHMRFFNWPEAETRFLSAAHRWDFSAVLKTRRILMEKRIDVLMYFAAGPGTFIAPMAAIAAGLLKHRIIRIGGTSLDGLYPDPLRAADRLLLKRVGRTIVPSSYLKDQYLKRLRVPPGSVRVIPNGVDLPSASDRGILRKILNLGARTRIVGMVANLTANKSQSLLLSIFPELLKRFPDTELVFIGEGRMKQELNRMAGDLGVSSRVAIMGYRSDAQNLIAGLDAGVLCSRMEIYPNSLLEMMAHGVPVVATRVGGIPEFVRDGLDGILIPPGDGRALLEALFFLLGNPGIAARYGRNGKEKVSARFSAGAMTRAFERELAAPDRSAPQSTGVPS